MEEVKKQHGKSKKTLERMENLT